MEILNSRYNELIGDELTLHMIRDIIDWKKEEWSYDELIKHIIWLIEVGEKRKGRNMSDTKVAYFVSQLDR